MAVRYSVAVNDPSSLLGGNTASLSSNVAAAMEIWSRYLTGHGGASIDIAVNIADTSTGRASGGPSWTAYRGQSGTASVYEAGPAHELRTGTDRNGSGADITITVSPSYLTQTLWFDTTPLDMGDAVPANRIDAMSVFLHEIGHGLGMVGWYDTVANRPSTSTLSTYDQNVVGSGGRLWFVGENAQRANGGPVSLTSTTSTQNVYHYGNAQEDAGNAVLLGGLMNGVAFYYSSRYQIGQLDLAMLRDTGLRTFDPLRYIASNGDLIGAFGTDTAAGLAHYGHYGYAESRATERFSAYAYLATYTDLVGAFGVNATSATDHYIRYGYNEGRGIGFDTTAYLASNTDLLAAFGADGDRAARHWLEYGRSEARSLSSFDAAGYLARYGDLRAAFGTDLTAATRHYVENGYWEGRSPTGVAAAVASAAAAPQVTPPLAACTCGFCGGGVVAGLPATLAAVL